MLQNQKMRVVAMNPSFSVFTSAIQNCLATQFAAMPVAIKETSMKAFFLRSLF